ncbi:acetamidase/formamidase family protein [Undibacterium hunanense]|uniref:acetamidase/formamidase family protein n=1 Tax=Undibacterium hunanense TaxID=2762292 RepID=UPI001C9A6F64|nr:acetamidase/formamidase family protein [Undibacterium hunanense]
MARAAGEEQWLLQLDRWGNISYQAMTLKAAGNAINGQLDGDSLAGTRNVGRISFIVTDKDKASYTYNGTVTQDVIQGVADFPDTNNPQARASHAFSARRLPERPAGPARVYDFQPKDYSNEFSPHRLPVLTVWPGDSVHTKTIDSGGVDEHGVTKALYGNPQTGPFYVATAEPGDTLVIHLKRLRLNRDYADSLDSIVGRAMGPGLAAKAGNLGKPIRWKLDRERGLASPEKPTENLRMLSLPVRPMLGGLAVAPGNGSPPISTGDTGRFGGNMDFNEVVEGNTVYLTVQQPGALLYLGDAHALQGDGETSQYALETSMDVEFSVDVIKGKSVASPRVESPTQIMVLGQAGSLDDALRVATSGMVQWLQQDYGLSLSECAQLFGTAIHFSIPNLAGRSVGVAAKIDKAVLATLRRP